MWRISWLPEELQVSRGDLAQWSWLIPKTLMEELPKITINTQGGQLTRYEGRTSRGLTASVTKYSKVSRAAFAQSVCSAKDTKSRIIWTPFPTGFYSTQQAVECRECYETSSHISHLGDSVTPLHVGTFQNLFLERTKFGTTSFLYCNQ